VAREKEKIIGLLPLSLANLKGNLYNKFDRCASLSIS